MANRSARQIRQIESTREPFTLNRISVARLASAIGSAALVIGVLALMFVQDVNAVVVGCALIAAVGLGLWLALAPNDLRALLTGRQTRYGTNSFILGILFTGIVVVVYQLAAGSGVAVDLTSLGYYSLKSDVRPVITNLQRPIQITAFYSTSLLDLQSSDRPILKMFTDAAPNRIRLVVYDPLTEPIIARDFGLDSQYGIFVSYVGLDGKPEIALTERMIGDRANERWIAEAILRLEARGKFLVVFPVGSGEITTDGSVGNDASVIRKNLDSFNIVTRSVDLTKEDIPSGTSAIIIVAPQRDYTQAMVDKIAAYMANGGRLFLMAEPAFVSTYTFMTTDDSPMTKYVWETWGIKPNKDIVFDPESYSDNQYYVVPVGFADSPMLALDASGASIQPRFGITQSFAVERREGLQTQVLYTSSSKSFGKLNLAEVARQPDRAQPLPGDPVGPLNLMVAVVNERSGARLVVTGDSDWVRDDLIFNFNGNILFSNAFDFLTSFVQRITINPVAGQLPLVARESDLNIVRVVTLFVVPGLALLLAGLVWFDRARRG